MAATWRRSLAQRFARCPVSRILREHLNASAGSLAARGFGQLGVDRFLVALPCLVDVADARLTHRPVAPNFERLPAQLYPQHAKALSGRAKAIVPLCRAGKCVGTIAQIDIPENRIRIFRKVQKRRCFFVTDRSPRSTVVGGTRDRPRSKCARRKRWCEQPHLLRLQEARREGRRRSGRRPVRLHAAPVARFLWWSSRSCLMRIPRWVLPSIRTRDDPTSRRRNPVPVPEVHRGRSQISLAGRCAALKEQRANVAYKIPARKSSPPHPAH